MVEIHFRSNPRWRTAPKLELVKSIWLGRPWDIRFCWNLANGSPKPGCDLSRMVFYSASALLAMQSAVLARGILSVCPSVRPSRSGIVSRRMKLRSCGFQHLVGQSLSFWSGKVYADIRRESPPAGALKWGTPLSIAKIRPIIGHNLETAQDRR